MKAPPFVYLRPQSLEEALAQLEEHGEDGKVLAGGQSLVAAMNFRLARPSALVDINGIANLDYIRQADKWLLIGALARHSQFERQVVAGPLGNALSSVVPHIAHYPIRNRGTFAGSLAHADPASEWCLVSITLDAEIVASSTAGARSYPASEFFKSAFTTALKSNEVLTEIRLPVLSNSWRTGFCEFSRRAGDFALAMAFVALDLDGDIIRTARIGLGGIESRPSRLVALERAITGKAVRASFFDELAEQARSLVDPIEDIHGSQNFRRHLAAGVIGRALHASFEANPLGGIK